MRRDRGDGSIYQRADGKWVAQLDISGGVKPRRFIRRSYTTKTEAKAGLKDMLPVSAAMTGVGRVTVAGWLTDWLKARKGAIRPSTMHSYRDMAERIVIPAIGHLELAGVTIRQVQTWADLQLRKGTGRRTVEYARSMLRAAYTDAVRQGICATNPATLVKLPPARQRDVPPVQPVHMRRLLAAATGHWLYPLIVLTLLYGLRRGELLGLADDAIDEQSGTLMIKRTVIRVGTTRRISEPKTARSRRVLPLHPLAIEAIAMLKQRRAVLSAGKPWRPARRSPTWLIPSELGNPLNFRQFHLSWIALRKKARLKSLTWHQLRHAAVAIRKGAGIDTRAIADTVGHVHVSLTDVVYDHGTIERIAEGVEATAKALKVS